MSDFQLDDLMAPEKEFNRSRYPQKVSASKRREIEALKERRELQKILNDIDVTKNHSFDDIQF